MHRRIQFVGNNFWFFLIKTDCISSSETNESQAEISRWEGGVGKAKISVLEICLSVCMIPPEHCCSPTFFFSGVLARYTEYQSLSLREKPEQRLDINKLVFNEELRPAGATNCWFWTRLYRWQLLLEGKSTKKSMNSLAEFPNLTCMSCYWKKQRDRYEEKAKGQSQISEFCR